MEAKVSSKGQIVIPKEVREKLGLKTGDKVRLEIQEGRRVVIQPAVEPPKEIFVRGDAKLLERVLDEAKRTDERKVRNLLRALGVRD